MAYLQRQFGLSPDECACLFDDDNDLPMAHRCGSHYLPGLTSASVSRAETSKGEIHRVRVGPFASQDDAKAVMNKLNAAGVSGIMVPQ